MPESAFSGRCANYGETCFMGCPSLKIPFRWTLDGNLSCDWRAFYETKIPEFDLSGVKGEKINLKGYNNAATNLVWGPNARTFVDPEFGLTNVFFTGILPPDTTYKPVQNRTVRFFCDPLMDESWKNDTVMGVALSRPAAEDFAAYAEKFGVTAKEAARSVLGWHSTGSGHRLWLVKWKSPFRPGRGLTFRLR